jgi:hypothetical protein
MGVFLVWPWLWICHVSYTAVSGDPGMFGCHLVLIMLFMVSLKVCVLSVCMIRDYYVPWHISNLIWKRNHWIKWWIFAEIVEVRYCYISGMHTYISRSDRSDVCACAQMPTENLTTWYTLMKGYNTDTKAISVQWSRKLLASTRRVYWPSINDKWRLVTRSSFALRAHIMKNRQRDASAKSER